MASERIAIIGMGARTAVGEDLWASAAATRAGIAGFAQHPCMLDTAGEPMRVAAVQGIDMGAAGAERCAQLLLPAIEEAMYPLAGIGAGTGRMALSLALPPPRPGRPDKLEQALLRHVQTGLGTPFGQIDTYPCGHAAGLVALQAACAALHRGELDACMVAGVDTYLDADTLEWLERCDQLHGSGHLNNAWGFIPGEAGAALLLMRQADARAAGMPQLAHVLATGAGHEDKRIKTDTVCIGAGLTQAFGQALVTLEPGRRVTDIYCDMNGEPYRADEYGFTALRMKQHFESVGEFVAPADCCGDVGAAGGPLHLALATAAGLKHYSKGALALVWASAEAGERATALLECGGAGAR